MKIRNKPYYKDLCDHGPACFMGSTTYQEFSGQELVDRHIDVYVWEGSHGKEQNVCIRYGIEDSEYISAGNMVHFVKTAEDNMHLAYSYAMGVLQAKGTFKYEVKPNDKL